MLASEQMRIVLLGTYGFSGKFIQSQVARYDRTEYSLSTIYRTLSKAGIRLKDYRDGLTAEAMDLAGRQQSDLPRKRRAKTKAA